MEDKITTIDQYNKCLKEKKELRDNLFDLRLEMFMNKKNPEKSELLQKKLKLLKSKIAKLSIKINTYELENEEKKEGIKK